MKKLNTVLLIFILAACVLAGGIITSCARHSSRQEKEHGAVIAPDETEAPELITQEAEPEIDESEQARASAAQESSYTYTARASAGSFVLTGPLPSNGVNIAELNPANYQKINREAMEGMGMSAHYVAYLAGEKYYEEGNYDKAIAEFGRAISLKADYTGAFVYRGNARRKMGELNRAIEDYSRALNLDSEYAEVYNYRGFSYAKRGDLRRAIDDYTQAIRCRANYTDAYFNRAYAYSEQGSWDEAIADYTQVIKLEPSNAIAYNERGNAWYNKGDRLKAAADFDTADKIANR